MKHVLQASDSTSNAATQQAAAAQRRRAAFVAERSDALTDRPTRSTTHRHRPFLQPLSYTPPRLRPAAKYPQLRIVPCRHVHRARRAARPPPCCVCNAAYLRAPPFDSYSTYFLTLRPPVSTAPTGVHQPLPFAAPRPHRRFAYPPPPPRPALLRLDCATTSSHANQPPATTACPPRPRLPASSRRVGGCVLAQRPACWRRACWRNAPVRFCTASRTDARFSSSPSAPCRLTGVQVRHCLAWAGCRGPLRASASQLALARGLGLAGQHGALNGAFWAGCA